MKLFSKILEEMSELEGTLNEELYDDSSPYLHTITTIKKGQPEKHHTSGKGWGDDFNRHGKDVSSEPEHKDSIVRVSSHHHDDGEHLQTKYYKNGKEHHLHEETLDELYDNRKSGGGHGHPFFHKINIKLTVIIQIKNKNVQQRK
jgi:hypothetical protein